MQTKTERMALIRQAAKNFQAKQNRAARFRRMETKPDQDKQLSEIYWTDSRQYAAEYYGDVYRQTTRYDNDWD